MRFLNNLWELKKMELAFTVEHYGVYLILGTGLIALCVYIHFSKDDDNEL